MRMQRRNARVVRRTAAAVTAASALILTTACSSTGGDAAAEPDQARPVAVEMWGWETTTTPLQVEAFNASQDEWKLEYITQASNTATQTNFQNLMASGGEDVPCVVPSFTTITTLLAEGWAQEVTDLVEESDVFSDGAKAGVEINGGYYGIPQGGTAQFAMAYKPAFDAAGLEIPATWEDLLAVAPTLAEAGVDTLNLPGEDPSGFINLAQQAGAEWFAIDGDEWVVNFVGDETLKATEFYQELIDNDWVSNQTYQDKPALYSYFDSGKLAFVPLGWWSMPGYATNFTNTLGEWYAVPNPNWADDPDAGAPGVAGGLFVPVGCEYPEAALAWGEYISSPEGIEASRNPETNAIAFPTAIADPSAYTADVVPEGLFSQPAEEVGPVIVESQAKLIGKFEKGPNESAWFPELQDQWGKAVAGQQTLEEALQKVQDFVVSDLEEKGISYRVG